MKQVSINNLKAQINARIKQIGQSNIFMSGTFVRKSNNGSIAHTVTSKVKGKKIPPPNGYLFLYYLRIR